MKKRLQNILAHRGIASRRKSGDLIKKGKVEVDGKVVTDKGMRLDPSEHKITFNGKALPEIEEKVYFIVNKTQGVVSTAKDTHSRPIVTDLIPDITQRLYPSGRLDMDSTGLVLLTNDGFLANMVMHPSYEIEKEYVVEASPPLEKHKLDKFEKGIVLDGSRTAPCSIKVGSSKGKKAVYKVIIHEGRKRQIRRMFESLGSEVQSLHRTRIGPLSLKGLRKGQYRELGPEEIKKLKKTLKRGEQHET